MPQKRTQRGGTERMATPRTPSSRGSSALRTPRVRTPRTAPPAPGCVPVSPAQTRHGSASGDGLTLPPLSPRALSPRGSALPRPTPSRVSRGSRRRSSRGGSPSSGAATGAALPLAGGAPDQRVYARHVGDAGADLSTSRRAPAHAPSPPSSSPRKRTINVVKPPSRHALGRYAHSPRHRTRTELKMGQLEQNRPHPSFDVDGDGTVSAFDYKLAKLFDADGNGILDEEETQELRKMMAKQNTESIARMLKACKKKDPEFEALKKRIVEGQTEAEASISGKEAMTMRNAFNAVDLDQGGSIGVDELMKLSIALENPMTEAAVQKMMKEIDVDHSGEVDFGEFKKYWLASKSKRAPSETNMFAGLDLDSEEFRHKIDRLAAQARKMNGAYNSQGACAVMDQTAAINPNATRPGKIYGEPLTKQEYFAPPGSKTNSAAGTPKHTPGGSPKPPASPELWPKGSNIFRMVASKLESKGDIQKVFRQFDANKDGTVDYRELRTGLSNMNIEMSDQEFKELVELIDEDRSGDIDYQEFCNADVMGSKMFNARQIQGNSGCKSYTELLGARRRKNAEFAGHKIAKRYDSYMLGGVTGYFGEPQELDNSMLAQFDADGNGVMDEMEALAVREQMQKSKIAAEAANCVRTPWAVNYPDDPRNQVY